MINFLCDLPESIKEKLVTLLPAMILALDNNPGISKPMPERTDRENNLLSTDIDTNGVKVLISNGKSGWKPEFVKYDRLEWPSPLVDPRISIQRLLHDAIPQFNAFSFSGAFRYLENGGQSWHTNWDADHDGLTRTIRLYFCKNADANSEFRIFDTSTDTVLCLAEPIGWTLNVFDLTQPLWHCVKAGTERTSIGIALQF